VLINGGRHITIGGLFYTQYQDWVANGRTLDISDYSGVLVPSGGCFEIGTIQGMEDLLGFADVPGYTFRLAADMNLSGAAGLYIPYLAGTLDGDDHTISGLDLDLSFVHALGLVGVNVLGTVCNVVLVDGNVSGGLYTGGLVGLNYLGTVSNSSAALSVTGGSVAGGLVGGSFRGTVSFSSAEGVTNGTQTSGGLVGHVDNGTVSSSFARGRVSGAGEVGGLVGSNMNGRISDSYASVRVEGAKTAGGLVGYTYGGNISSSYSAGVVAGKGAVGGFAGRADGPIVGCFWDTETSGQGSSGGGMGCSTKEMRTRATFADAGWDFTNVWAIVEGVTYPFLRWQDAEAPMADAGPDQAVDDGTLVMFDGRGSIDDCGICNYTWTLMDGIPVTLEGIRPAHRFDNAGTFVVMLNVTDALGRWDVDSLTVTVNDATPPVADAGPDQTVDEGTIVVFDGSGSSDNVGIVNWTWDFVYGMVFPVPIGHIYLFGETPQFTFPRPGIYDVTLTVSDAAGHSSSDSMTVTVVDIKPPLVDAGPDLTVDEGTLVRFDKGFCMDSGGIANYTWAFGYGTQEIFLYEREPTFTFDIPGRYVVSLKVTDFAGHWSTDFVNLTVSDIISPVANAGPDQSVNEGITVSLDGRGSFDSGGIASHTWTFDLWIGPVVLYGVSPPFRFDVPGSYVVTLNVTDAAGHWGEDTVTITVRDLTPPVAKAPPSQEVPIGGEACLDGSLSTDNVGITEYTWTFTYDGRLRTLNGSKVRFTFDRVGIYDVILTVADHAGNRDDCGAIIIVVATGRVTGTVLDRDGKLVGGAEVTITASDGRIYSRFTSEDGSFIMNVSHGNFTWRISKEGYKTISGDSSVAPMDTAELDLSDTPLVSEDEVGFMPSPPLISAVIAGLVVIGYALFVLGRKRKEGPGGIT